MAVVWAAAAQISCLAVYFGFTSSGAATSGGLFNFKTLEVFVTTCGVVLRTIETFRKSGAVGGIALFWTNLVLRSEHYLLPKTIVCVSIIILASSVLPSRLLLTLR